MKYRSNAPVTPIPAGTVEGGREKLAAMNSERKRSEVKQQSSFVSCKIVHASTKLEPLTDLGLGRCPITLTASPGANPSVSLLVY